MKEYNFTLLHKCIDNVDEAKAKVAKAKMELIGSIYEADFTAAEDDVLHDVMYDMETVKCILDKIHKNLCKLEEPI